MYLSWYFDFRIFPVLMKNQGLWNLNRNMRIWSLSRKSINTCEISRVRGRLPVPSWAKSNKPNASVIFQDSMIILCQENNFGWKISIFHDENVFSKFWFGFFSLKNISHKGKWRNRYQTSLVRISSFSLMRNIFEAKKSEVKFWKCIFVMKN